MRLHTRLTELFPRWLHSSPPWFTPRPIPSDPTARKAAIRKTAQLAADQEWEAEGGSIRGKT